MQCGSPPSAGTTFVPRVGSDDYQPTADPCDPSTPDATGCVLTATCYTAGVASGWNFGSYGSSPLNDTCAAEPAARPARASVTTGQVLTQFRRLDWPAAELHVQPPGGATLVNLPTVFYATPTETLTRTVTLLGQRVQIQAWPQSYTWHHGDDTSQITDHPGAELTRFDARGEPVLDDGTVHHTYLHRSEVLVSVDVTYAGEYRVGDGGWIPIGGTHTVPGGPQSLTVRTARPVLVD